METLRDEIIDLNVGGKRMTTTRLTLCQIEGSLLANLFNSPQTPLDKDGFIFLDFNPKHFARILDYLRAKKISSPENPAPLPTVGSSEIKSFKNLVQHLGLFDEIFPIIKESFVGEHCSEIRVDENGTRVVFPSYSTPNNTCWNASKLAYAFGKHVYDSGVFRFKLRLYWDSRMVNQHWGYQNNVDIGLINEDISSFSDRSFDGFGSPYFIGWTLDRNEIRTYGNHGNHSCRFGRSSDQRYSWKYGDIIELLLDLDAAMLFLNTPDGQQFQVELPKWIKPRLYVGLKKPNTALHILEVRKER